MIIGAAILTGWIIVRRPKRLAKGKAVQAVLIRLSRNEAVHALSGPLQRKLDFKPRDLKLSP